MNNDIGRIARQNLPGDNLKKAQNKENIACGNGLRAVSRSDFMSIFPELFDQQVNRPIFPASFVGEKSDFHHVKYNSFFR